MLLRTILVLCLFAVLPAHQAAASPAADFTCIVKAHPDIQRDGYLAGHGIYIMSDDVVGLVGYAEPVDQLQRIVSGSGMQFSNGKVTFGAKGEEGFLEMSDGTLFPCKIAAASILSPATALGTIVRAGPSVDSGRLDKLPEGEPVSLLEEAGNYMDGFQWFKISYSEGLEGYAWGGTMCVDTELPGILIGCSRFTNTASGSNGNGSGNAATIPARSLFGSKIREAADPAARQIASIAEGTTIEILQETGSFFDGWQWVRIRYGNGEEGYVWGGTICVTSGQAPTGVHASCN